MYELRPKEDSTASRKDRKFAVLMGLVVLVFSYGAFDSFFYELRAPSFGRNAVEALSRLLLLLAVWIIGGFFGYGVIRASAGAYLRIEAGFLEHHWKFWNWERVNKLDLRTIADIKLGDHIFYSRGRKVIPAILFTLKTDSPASLDEVRALGRRHLPLPRGVSKEETQSFLELIQQEMKRATGQY
jgi:hypothetical protein